LDEEGVESVTKWTAKRGINVFDKKFVFIPINENVHWSLCVVVNPGHINEDAEDGPMACLLFLDSLKAHSKKKISKQVRKWLNSEWWRIRGDGDVGQTTLFNSKTAFPLLTPTSESLLFLSSFYNAVFRANSNQPFHQSLTRTTAGIVVSLCVAMLLL
jgi:Ulp1 protease family, C-terminal catalytic domain